MKRNFYYHFFLPFLGPLLLLLEIFHLFFLLSTQFLFYDLFKTDELNLLKTNGLSNFKIIKILFFTSIIIGLLSIIIFYNAASKLKYFYTDIKNNFSNDNKYLAVVTESGLWLKDEIDNSTLIVKAGYIEDDFLNDVIINQFDKNFDLIKTIQSNKVNIYEKKWIIEDPIITFENISEESKERLILKTNFNKEKISGMFSNISTLNILELFDLKKDYENLGYSSNEIVIHLLRLGTTPLLYGILTLLSAVIMFNFK